MAAEPARPEPVLRGGKGHDSERPLYRKNKNKNKTKCPSKGPQGSLGSPPPVSECFMAFSLLTAKTQSTKFFTSTAEPFLAAIAVAIWEVHTEILGCLFF